MLATPFLATPILATLVVGSPAIAEDDHSVARR